VTQGISPEIKEELAARLPKIERQTPFLKCPRLGTWVKPTITCRTSFKYWSDEKVMEQPLFKELLAEIDGI